MFAVYINAVETKSQKVCGLMIFQIKLLGVGENKVFFFYNELD